MSDHDFFLALGSFFAGGVFMVVVTVIIILTSIRK